MQLRDYLRLERLSPHEFAEKVGFTVHAVHKWARRERRPNEETIDKIEEITKGAVTPGDWTAKSRRKAAAKAN